MWPVKPSSTQYRFEEMIRANAWLHVDSDSIDLFPDSDSMCISISFNGLRSTHEGPYDIFCLCLLGFIFRSNCKWNNENSFLD